MFVYATTAPWAFFLSMMLVFTGAAAEFDRKTTNIVHFTGAVLGIAGAVIGISIQFLPWFWILFLYLGLIVTAIVLITGNHCKLLWYIEIYSFTMINITLYAIYLWNIN